MINTKDDYEIKYFEGRWRIFLKGDEKPIPTKHYGSKVEAELGLEESFSAGRRLFRIDVSNLPKGKAEDYIKELMYGEDK